MSDFDKRIEKGKDLYLTVKKILDDYKIPYFETGYENLTNINGAKNLIIKNKDKTSEFIRFYPDMLLVFWNRSFLLEIKNSSGIEKECYENYISLVNNFMLDVLICCKNLKICKIQDVIFKAALRHDYLSGLDIPITDNIWREPRLMSKDDYFKYMQAYKDKNKFTSGCSFAFIDFEKTKFYDFNVLRKYIKNE